MTFGKCLTMQIKKPLIPKKDIQSILLQRPPIVMIDELLDHTETSTQTSFEIQKDNVFISDEKMREPGLIENIAQTAACRLGYIALITGAPLAVGYIGAIKKLHIHDLPTIGSQLITRINITNTIFNVTVANAEIQLNGNIIASCEMKIFIVE